MYRHLVLEKQVAVETDGGIEDIFGYNGPTQMVTKILHKPEYSSDATLAEFERELIVERTRTGLAAARGRKRGVPFKMHIPPDLVVKF